MSAPASRREGGFTLLEVLVALLVTIIGLAGVLMMQALTTRANRQNAELSRASMIAEETIELARGIDINTLLANTRTYAPETFKNVTYTISLSAAEVSPGSNLVRITAAVSYSEDSDTSTADDRTVQFQMLRTKTEML